MARQLKKADCWKKPQVRVGEGLIEVAEKKAITTFFVALWMLFTLGLFSMLGLGMLISGQFDLGAIVALAIAQGIPMLLVLAIYRPPRTLQVFPNELIAQRYHVFIRFKFKRRWYDLSESAILIERRLGKGDAELTGLGAALGCLLFFTGPFGLLFSLLGPKKYAQIPFYCLTHPSEGRRPIAVFEKRSVPARLENLYQAAEQKK